MITKPFQESDFDEALKTAFGEDYKGELGCKSKFYSVPKNLLLKHQEITVGVFIQLVRINMSKSQMEKAIVSRLWSIILKEVYHNFL